ncbi:hypothetical protein T07_9662 [Trichinella nelsoni]|uniref:Uncharacterized protein n=1 Tax=Trichinella nelsoni TaxID=6336 RepID=A0A0V0SF26_9BILA|nr:hypothetical protein T07_9662 [Trichinella nelsoni]
MLLFCLPKDNDVVEIAEACLPRQSPLRFYHQPLKRRRGVAQAERHDAELEDSQGCGKRCFLPVFFGDLDLPVAGRQVEDAEPLGPRQRIQRIVYARDGLSVDARHGIQAAVVDAEPRGAVLLSDQHYR